MNSVRDRFSAQSEEAPRAGPFEAADAKFAFRYPLHILIAEDNYINRRLLLILLKNLGYDADAVENGAECLAAVLAGSYDIVLSDIDMPEMSGIDCALHLREAGIGIPLIAITASNPELTRKECLDAGMNDYMRKPLNVTELKRVLREAALRKGMDEANRTLLLLK